MAKLNKASPFLLLAVIVATTFLFSNFIGLSRTGFDSAEILRLQSFYLIGGIFGLGIFAFLIYEMLESKGDSKYGSSLGFSSQGKFPHDKFFGRFTNLQLFLLAFMFFGVVGLLNLSFTDQKTYTEVAFLEAQQFTAVDSIIYSALLVPGAENLGFALFFMLIVFGIKQVSIRLNLSRPNYQFYYYIVPLILGGLFGLGNHFLRYQGSDFSLTIVYIFWSIGALITAVSGSFIPFWVMHIINNLTVDLSRFVSSDIVLIYLYRALIVGVGGIYWLLYRDKLLGEQE